MRIITVDGPQRLDVGLYARLLAAELGLRCIKVDSGQAVPLQGAVIVRGGALFSAEAAVKLYLCSEEMVEVPPDSWGYDVYRHTEAEEAARCMAQLYYLARGLQAGTVRRVPIRAAQAS